MYQSSSSTSSSSQRSSLPGGSGGLIRYGSAPGSLLNSVVDEVIGGSNARDFNYPPPENFLGHFFTGADSSSLRSDSTTCGVNSSDGQKNLGNNKDIHLDRSYGGFNEISQNKSNDVGNSSGSYSLARQRSSPADFFSYLSGEKNSFSLNQPTSDYNPQGGSNAGRGQSRLKSQLSFTSHDPLSRISEDNETSVHDGSGHSFSAASFGAATESWDDGSGSIGFTVTRPTKRAKDIDSGLFSQLADVRPFKSTWKVRVKVLHSWRQFSGMSGETMELVFADEHGGKMHAGVKKKDIGRLSKELRDGEWKVVENFTLAPASGQYRPTNSAWKMSLTMNTVVSNCSIKSPEMFLSLVPIQTIIDGGLNQNFLIDVMGQVLDVSEIKSVPVAGKEKRKLECVFRGSSDDQRINCCLWSGYADQLYDACKKADGQTVICLIRFAKINFYQGELQVTNGYDASKLIINPRCSEAESFMHSLPDDGAMIVIKEDDEEQAKQSMKEKEEEWLSMETKSLYDIQIATEIEKFKVCCKVTGVDTDYGWYYFGCGKCQFRVSKDLKKEASTKPRPKVPIWFCEKCKTNVKNVAPKFKLHLLVEDETAKSKVMLLDTVAAGIVMKSASFLLNGSYDEIQDPELLPDAIKSLIGNSYEFLVGVEKEHIQYGKDTYKVHKARKGLLILSTESGDEHFTTIENGSTIGSCEEVSVVKSNSYSISDDGSTPSPKRPFGEMQSVPALCSTSKKHCPKLPQLEENKDLVNPEGIAKPYSVSNPSEAFLIQQLND